MQIPRVETFQAKAGMLPSESEVPCLGEPGSQCGLGEGKGCPEALARCRHSVLEPGLAQLDPGFSALPLLSFSSPCPLLPHLPWAHLKAGGSRAKRYFSEGILR